MVDADICVIGAGIMGSAAAYWLSRLTTQRVLLIDQYTLMNNHCSSNDANRVFRYAYGSNTAYTEMAVKSHQLWKTLENETGKNLLVPSGLLMLTGEDKESNNFNKSSYNTLIEKGHGAEWLETHDLKKRFPQFTATDAVLDPNGGVLLASKCLSVLNIQARQRGVQILENIQATRVTAESNVTIQTSRGTDIRCRIAVITAGPWSNNFRNRNMVEITPTRQQVVYFNPGPNIDEYRPSSFPVFFADQYYGLPAAGIEAVKISHKGVWLPVDPDKADREADPAKVEEYRKICQRFVPNLATTRVTSTKVCLYDMTKDSDFVIGRCPENPHVIYGYGFSGHGFKFAVLIGKILAELATVKTPSFDISRFASERIPSPLVQPVA